MILYKGKIFKNSYQLELIESLKNELDKAAANGITLDVETVICACDKLAQRVKNGDFDDIVKPFLRQFNISDTQFTEMLKLFTREGLEYKCAVELSDDERVIDGKIIRKRYPLGVLFHIAAGNLDVLPAYSVIEGLLSGNINILKLPMGDSGLSVRLLYELVQNDPALADFIYVFDVPSTETETLKRLAGLADGVAVWGGDAAVRAARAMVDVDTKIIAWGHKLSFAYAEADAPDDQLYALARSICDTNQLLCSSCQGIFIDTDDKSVQLEFSRRFFEIFKRANAAASPADFGMKAKNAINIYNEMLERHISGKEILSEDGISVLACNDSELELSYMYRSVWIKRLTTDKIYTLKKNKNHLQTAAVVTASAEKRKIICERLANAGVTRITSGGNMSRTVCGEAHDGTYALREYSKIVETEIFDEIK